MAKDKDGTYHKSSFLGVINISLNLIPCEDNICISEIIQSYVLHCYHTYLLHPGIYRTEEMICQHFTVPESETPYGRK